MLDRKLLIVAILGGVVALYVADMLLGRYWRYVPANAWVSGVVAFGLLGYIVVMVATGGRLRLRLPSRPRRRPLRVVKRDPSTSAADFIRRFEERNRR